jgi:epoxyqueuosine reductase
MRRKLELVVSEAERALDRPVVSRVFADSVPLLERALARQAALGFIGRNTMLIVPGKGSFLFLGELLWNIDVDVDVESAPVRTNCGSCTRCLSKCPTGAFVKEHTLDARRCTSYLTIEKRGSFSMDERQWVGEWIFGCDVCQEVCPFNHSSLKKAIAADAHELGRSKGAGPLLDLAKVLSIRTHEEFCGHFAGTPIMRARRDGLLRNAAVVAVNTQSLVTLPALLLAAREDPSDIVRQHALWALHSLARLEGGAQVSEARDAVERGMSDVSPIVAEEARRLMAE